MPSTLNHSRSIAYRTQGGCCFYCHMPTWQKTPEEFATRHGLSIHQARAFQRTAEHLRARQDGGKNSRSNIVVACWFCNNRRHRRKKLLSPNEYKAFVQKRLAQGRWHLQLLQEEIKA